MIKNYTLPLKKAFLKAHALCNDLSYFDVIYRGQKFRACLDFTSDITFYLIYTFSNATPYFDYFICIVDSDFNLYRSGGFFIPY